MAELRERVELTDSVAAIRAIALLKHPEIARRLAELRKQISDASKWLRDANDLLNHPEITLRVRALRERAAECGRN